MLITHYLDPGPLLDAELELLDSFYEANLERGWVPYYRFRMVNTSNRALMGNISLRLGNQPAIVLYAGHIGYGVDEPYRGHHYAARSVKLILPHALKHGINPLWITCNPDNLPSRRSCEIAGGKMIEIVDLPPDNPMYKIGERQKCRYRFDL
jgi:tagatose 1,6-diphosphate aldolase